MVGEALASGARSIYVDYVDYDAVAHHAGIMRPESLDALVGLDALLGQLEKVAAEAQRDYRIVVLSDHGQSQGEVFADRYGESLSDLVSRLAGTTVAGTEVNTEGSARVDVLTEEQPPLVAQALRAGQRRHHRAGAGRGVGGAGRGDVLRGRRDAGGPVPRSSRCSSSAPGTSAWSTPAARTHRLTRAEIEARWPALLPGLAGHEGVSFARRGDRRRPGRDRPERRAPAARRRRDRHRPADRRSGPRPPRSSCARRRMPEAPDIAVNSLLDPVTGEVAAFEGLVGCHGGLGGWQDRAMLVWPSDLPRPPERLVGADAVHRQLVVVAGAPRAPHRPAAGTAAGLRRGRVAHRLSRELRGRCFSRWRWARGSGTSTGPPRARLRCRRWPSPARRSSRRRPCR